MTPAREGHDLLDILERVVGMQADGRVNVHVTGQFRDGEGLCRRGGVGTDHHHAVDPRGEGPRQDF